MYIPSLADRKENINKQKDGEITQSTKGKKL